MLNRINFLGYDFVSEQSNKSVVDDILKNTSFGDSNKLPFLITPNVDYLVKLNKRENFDLKQALLKSRYILPDGMPIVLSSRFFNRNLSARLTGSDLFPILWRKSIFLSKNILVLSSSDEISIKLKKESPNVESLTMPFFSADDNTIIDKIVLDCIEVILSKKTYVVFIGLGFPKQDIIALRIYESLKKIPSQPMPLFCMLGASFEFYLHIKKRAPLFWQKIGAEWLFRFMNEPTRLFKRYFIDSWAFVQILFRESK
ncbi:WecB/TagA/CpsF family glycosyltransferase [Pedobacter sp. AW1-32]|uniref:WecB/TagA/CpsF family glycosyltransferase n=1 Tax=Pedobacter sp. AW1-32 TaxID=3383026 RepID=UPI003FF09B79